MASRSGIFFQVQASMGSGAIGAGEPGGMIGRLTMTKVCCGSPPGSWKWKRQAVPSRVSPRYAAAGAPQADTTSALVSNPAVGRMQQDGPPLTFGALNTLP